MQHLRHALSSRKLLALNRELFNCCSFTHPTLGLRPFREHALPIPLLDEIKLKIHTDHRLSSFLRQL